MIGLINARLINFAERLATGFFEVKLEEKIRDISRANDRDCCIRFWQPAQIRSNERNLLPINFAEGRGRYSFCVNQMKMTCDRCPKSFLSHTQRLQHLIQLLHQQVGMFDAEHQRRPDLQHVGM
jgi:hypothetical protein